MGEGEVTNGYQIAFRVWDSSRYMYRDRNMQPYGLDFWTSAFGTDIRMDFTSIWEPICDIDTFERMAADFHSLVGKYQANPKPRKTANKHN